MTDKYEIDLNVRPGEDLLDEEMAGNPKQRKKKIMRNKSDRSTSTIIIPATCRTRDTK